MWQPSRRNRTRATRGRRRSGSSSECTRPTVVIWLLSCRLGIHGLTKLSTHSTVSFPVRLQVGGEGRRAGPPPRKPRVRSNCRNCRFTHDTYQCHDVVSLRESEGALSSLNVIVCAGLYPWRCTTRWPTLEHWSVTWPPFRQRITQQTDVTHSIG